MICPDCGREIVDPTQRVVLGSQALDLCLQAPDDGGPRSGCLTLALALARQERDAEKARADRLQHDLDVSRRTGVRLEQDLHAALTAAERAK